MMSPTPPAKRPEAHQIPTPEAKRPKIDDDHDDDDGSFCTSEDLDALFTPDPPKPQDDSLRRLLKLDYDFEKRLSYCLFCEDMVDHCDLECPDRSKGSGIYCFVCERGPCKSSHDEHHMKHHLEIVMFCNICGSQGKHWSDNCPYRGIYEDDSDPENQLGCPESAGLGHFYD